MNDIGDRVVLVRAKSVAHFKNAPFGKSMPITGCIIAVDFSHHEGHHRREIQIQFDDGRVGWYGLWEIASDRSDMYDVLLFRDGNKLEKRANLYYRERAVKLALEWQDEVADWRDSVQVYKDGSLIWVDGRKI
jgi:hypothetical protein